MSPLFRETMQAKNDSRKAKHSLIDFMIAVGVYREKEDVVCFWKLSQSVRIISFAFFF